MQRIFFPFFRFLPLFSFSQNWNLFPEGQISNFGKASLEEIDCHIWVDSMSITPDGDSIFYLNRIARQVFNGDELQYCVLNQQQFLQRQVLKIGTGTYHFQGDSSTFVLLVDQPIGTEWVFDTTNQVSATVIDVLEENAFGVSDSTQIISLSSGDSIRLSKRFGVLSFPDLFGGGAPFSLVGIDQTSYGLQVPKAKDFFALEPGDSLFYNGSDGIGYMWGWPGYEKAYVYVGDVSIGDTVRKVFDVITRNEIYNTAAAPNWVYHSTVYSTDTIEVLPDHYTNHYKGEVVAIDAMTPECPEACCGYHYNNPMFSVIQYQYANDGTFIKQLGDEFGETPLLVPSVGGDSLLQVSCVYWSYFNEYRVGPGLRKWENLCFESTGWQTLAGSVIDGVQTGFTYSIAYLEDTLSTDDLLISNNDLKVFPNPANDFLTLQCTSSYKWAAVEGFNARGELVQVYRGSFSKEFGFAIGDLPEGVYFLRLTEEDTGRFMSASFQVSR